MKTRLRCRTSQGKCKVVKYMDKEFGVEDDGAQASDESGRGRRKHATNPEKLKLANTNSYLNARTKHANTSSS